MFGIQHRMRFSDPSGSKRPEVERGSRDLWASPEKRLRLGRAQASLALHSLNRSLTY